MNRDQLIGFVILVASLIGVAVYGWVLYAFPMVVLQITAFLAVAGILVVLAWIGWTMATMPPPAPFEPETISEQPVASSGSEEKSRRHVAEK